MMNFNLGGAGNYYGFKQTFKATPMIAVRPEHEDSGKIHLPASALQRIASLNLVYPLMFELKNHKNPSAGSTHCGVLEFTAEEGKAYIPLWMMNNIGLAPGDFVTIQSTELPRGSFVKFRPKQVAFLDISDPRAVLEHMLRKYAALTVGETILFRYNDKDYLLEVLELKPVHQSHAVSIVETDIQVDFAPPEGYVEPQRPQQQQRDVFDEPDDELVSKDQLHEFEHGFSDSDEDETPEVKPFTGTGYKISGKPVESSPSRSAAALSKSPAGGPELATSPNGRSFITSSGHLVVGSPQESSGPGRMLGTGSGRTLGGGAAPSPAKPTASAPQQQQPSEDDKPTFVPFSGRGNTLK